MKKNLPQWRQCGRVGSSRANEGSDKTKTKIMKTATSKATITVDVTANGGHPATATATAKATATAATRREARAKARGEARNAARAEAYTLAFAASNHRAPMPTVSRWDLRDFRPATPEQARLRGLCLQWEELRAKYPSHGYGREGRKFRRALAAEVAAYGNGGDGPRRAIHLDA